MYKSEGNKKAVSAAQAATLLLSRDATYTLHLWEKKSLSQNAIIPLTPLCRGFLPAACPEKNLYAGKTMDCRRSFTMARTLISLHIIAIVHAFRLYFPLSTMFPALFIWYPMKNIIVGFALCALLVGAGTLSAQTDAHVENANGAFYGNWLKMQADTLSVTQAMEAQSAHGKEVMIAGTIADVCQKKGCWLVVSDGTSQMRVTFKDYGFFVPTTSSGTSVILQGIVSEEEIPEDLAKHYAEESKGEDPDTIEGPQKVITMVATGVFIRKD